MPSSVHLPTPDQALSSPAPLPRTSVPCPVQPSIKNPSKTPLVVQPVRLFPLALSPYARPPIPVLGKHYHCARQPVSCSASRETARQKTGIAQANQWDLGTSIAALKEGFPRRQLPRSLLASLCSAKEQFARVRPYLWPNLYSEQKYARMFTLGPIPTSGHFCRAEASSPAQPPFPRTPFFPRSLCAAFSRAAFPST